MALKSRGGEKEGFFSIEEEIKHKRDKGIHLNHFVRLGNGENNLDCVISFAAQ
jgi:hypothetical protein